MAIFKQIRSEDYLNSADVVNTTVGATLVVALGLSGSSETPLVLGASENVGSTQDLGQA